MGASLLLLLLAVALLRGASYLPTKWAVADLAPVAVVGGQVLIAAAIALVALASRPAMRRRTWALTRAQPRAVLLLGLTQTAAPLLLIAVALERIPSGLTAVLIAATPLFVAAFAAASGGARPTPAMLIGLALGLLGVGFVAGLGSGGLRLDLLGGMAALGAAVAYAVGALVVRRRFAETPALDVGVLAVLGSVPLTVAPALLALPSTAPGAQAIASVAALGVGALMVAVVLFIRLIQRAGAQRAMLVTYLNPAIALLLGAAFERERVTPRALAGLALILLGVALGSRGPVPPPPPRSASRVPAPATPR